MRHQRHLTARREQRDGNERASTDQAQQAQERNSVSYRLSPYGINLPCGMNMTEEKVGYVCAVLKRILRRGE